MQSDVDLYQAAIRYRGKPVIVQSHSYQKHVGLLTFCNYDFLVLTNSAQINELESNQWQDQIMMGNLEEGRQIGNEETLIRLYNILSISCNDPEIPPLSVETTPNEPATIGSIYRFEIKLGVELVELIAPGDAKLLKRIRTLRHDMKQILGFEISPLHVCDSVLLDTKEYQFLLDGTPVGGGKVYPGRHLAIPADQSVNLLPGEQTTEPAFGLDAVWLETKELITEAEAKGFTVVDAATVLITHLGETIKKHRADFLTYDLVCDSLKAIRHDSKSLVDDHFQLASERKNLFGVLQDLASEQVWIGCFSKIAEVVAMSREKHNDIASLSDHVRSEIGRHIVRDLLNEAGNLPAILLEPTLENEISTFLPALLPDTLTALIELIKEAAETIQIRQAKSQVPILVSSKRREFVDLFKRAIPQLQIMNFAEVPRDITLDVVEVIRKATFDSQLEKIRDRDSSEAQPSEPEA